MSHGRLRTDQGNRAGGDRKSERDDGELIIRRAQIAQGIVRQNKNLSPVTLFRCLTAMQPEESARAGILSGFSSLAKGIRETEVGFEPRTFRSVNSRFNP
ncbi:hypothetical protein T265_08300 [Opisthorchis viverrini]|uniref:Uncharacterized protein n=1 Tax=Opisthorchis viverrini TaxID=6198 RepID=A0A074ZKQ4_OPIVI|nr:hypothetical protein T265_08300 [Opisthorchis viverrini]KER23940.1 hypothetical protein T265_08300 [Opisthorchis viverrini]